MRESDIRPADVHAEYLRLSAADAAALFGNPATLSPRACPGCAADNPISAFAKNGFELSRCGDCNTLYVTPCPTETGLTALYGDSPSTRYWAQVFFPAVAAARRGRIFRPRAERVLKITSDNGLDVHRITDVGAGAAVLLEEMRGLRPDLICRAVEPGRDLADTCRNKGFETFAGYADEAARDPGWAGTADVAVCFEVIEHTSNSLQLVESLATLVKPGGLIVMSGLSGDGFDIQVLGRKSNAVSPPHHLTFLSAAGARRLLERANLEEVSISTPGELDVDIVLNALNTDPNCVEEGFLRSLLLGSDDATRASFQKFLSANCRSSHMWIVGRRKI